MAAHEVAGRSQRILIDLTRTTRAEMTRLREKCVQHGLHAAMASGPQVPLARETLAGSAVEASGGISTLDHVLSLFEAGADLAGTSAGTRIVEEAVAAEAGAERSGIEGSAAP